MAMMGGADGSKLKKCLEQLWDFIASLNLAPEDAKKLKKTVQNLHFRKAENNFFCAGFRNGCGLQAKHKRHFGQQIRSEENLFNWWMRFSLRGRTTTHERKSGNRSFRQRRFKWQAYNRNQNKRTWKNGATLTLFEYCKNHSFLKVTRIKGLQPGFQVVDDPSNPTKITIKRSKRTIKEPSQSTEALSKFNQLTPKTSAKHSEPALLTAVGGEGVSPDKIAVLIWKCLLQQLSANYFVL